MRKMAAHSNCVCLPTILFHKRFSISIGMAWWYWTYPQESGALRKWRCTVYFYTYTTVMAWAGVNVEIQQMDIKMLNLHIPWSSCIFCLCKNKKYHPLWIKVKQKLAFRRIYFQIYIQHCTKVVSHQLYLFIWLEKWEISPGCYIRITEKRIRQITPEYKLVFHKIP